MGGATQSRLFRSHHKCTTKINATATNIPETSLYESLPPEHRQKLWPFVAAIRNPEILDWRRHIFNQFSASVTATDNGDQEKSQNTNEIEEDEEERNVKIQEQSKKQANLPVPISADDLYLSDAINASNIEKLKNLGITHILNVGGKEAAIESDDGVYKKEGITRVTIEAKDEYGYPMLHRHLSHAMDFLQKCKSEEGKCVIHCAQGINRSGVLVAAIKMLRERKNVLDVVLHCRMQRGNWFMSSNQSFQEELVLLAEKEGLLGPVPGEDGCCLGILENEIPPYREGMFY